MLFRSGGGRGKNAMTGTEHIRQIVRVRVMEEDSRQEMCFGCDRDSVSLDSRAGIVYSVYRLEANLHLSCRNRKRQSGARAVQGNVMITLTGLGGCLHNARQSCRRIHQVDKLEPRE